MKTPIPIALGRRSIAWLGASLLTLATSPAALVKVSIENLSPVDGTFLTPVWVGFHNGSFDIYDLGSPATAGLERLAEDGNAAPLSGEFSASGFGSVQGVIPGPGGPLAPGDVTEMTFDLDGSLATNAYFSYASMVIPSNDAFIANGNPLAHRIFDVTGAFLGGDFLVLGTAVRDAGTEVNDEIPANTAFLGQVTPDTGIIENGTVQTHAGFLPGGDILGTFPNADFTEAGYQVAHITVTQVPASVPESGATFGMLALGVLALVRIRRGARKRLW